jgi:hypothetical protein
MKITATQVQLTLDLPDIEVLKSELAEVNEKLGLGNLHELRRFWTGLRALTDGN